MMQALLHLLAHIRRAYFHRDFTKPSASRIPLPRVSAPIVWFFARRLHAHPRMRELIGKRLLSATYPLKRDMRQLCLIPASKSDRPFVVEICRASEEKRSFIHEAATLWDGGEPEARRFRYAVVQTILLSGESFREIHALLSREKFNTKNVLFLTLIDCEQGAREALLAEGIAVRAVYSLKDILEAIKNKEFLDLPF
ncbi:MAG: hypothetical protein KGJ34_02780 [Patescibacteria group bacterium]|nr:hypothetical protein [Patescibacteria group bacterium]